MKRKYSTFVQQEQLGAFTTSHEIAINFILKNIHRPTIKNDLNLIDEVKDMLGSRSLWEYLKGNLERIALMPVDIDVKSSSEKKNSKKHTL